MRKLIVFCIFLAACTQTFSSECMTLDNGGFSFAVSGMNAAFNQTGKPSAEKMSFNISETSDKLLLAAILFSSFDALNFILGMTGVILYTVSTNTIIVSSETIGALFYGGIALMAWGFTWCGLLLAGVIVFWVLYFLNTKSAMNRIDVSNSDMAISVRL
jgi:hypothetical protein